MDLVFKKAQKDSQYRSIFEHNLDAFTDTPDFHWSLEEIKKEVKEGWELYAVYAHDEIVAALFLKLDGGKLLTKNTALIMSHQGSGYSHQIKEFVEQEAKKRKAKKIYHYCRIDNFRLYSLNESHGYRKTGRQFDEGQIVEWEKQVE